MPFCTIFFALNLTFLTLHLPSIRNFISASTVIDVNLLILFMKCGLTITVRGLGIFPDMFRTNKIGIGDTVHGAENATDMSGIFPDPFSGYDFPDHSAAIGSSAKNSTPDNLSLLQNPSSAHSLEVEGSSNFFDSASEGSEAGAIELTIFYPFVPMDINLEKVLLEYFVEYEQCKHGRLDQVCMPFTHLYVQLKKKSGFKIDVKKTKHKRFGKFLKDMEKREILRVGVVSGLHQVLYVNSSMVKRELSATRAKEEKLLQKFQELTEQETAYFNMSDLASAFRDGSVPRTLSNSSLQVAAKTNNNDATHHRDGARPTVRSFSGSAHYVVAMHQALQPNSTYGKMKPLAVYGEESSSDWHFEISTAPYAGALPAFGASQLGIYNGNQDCIWTVSIPSSQSAHHVVIPFCALLSGLEYYAALITDADHPDQFLVFSSFVTTQPGPRTIIPIVIYAEGYSNGGILPNPVLELPPESIACVNTSSGDNIVFRIYAHHVTAVSVQLIHELDGFTYEASCIPSKTDIGLYQFEIQLVDNNILPSECQSWRRFRSNVNQGSTKTLYDSELPLGSYFVRFCATRVGIEAATLVAQIRHRSGRVLAVNLSRKPPHREHRSENTGGGSTTQEDRAGSEGSGSGEQTRVDATLYLVDKRKHLMVQKVVNKVELLVELGILSPDIYENGVVALRYGPEMSDGSDMEANALTTARRTSLPDWKLAAEAGPNAQSYGRNRSALEQRSEKRQPAFRSVNGDSASVASSSSFTDDRPDGSFGAISRYSAYAQCQEDLALLMDHMKTYLECTASGRFDDKHAVTNERASIKSSLSSLMAMVEKVTDIQEFDRPAFSLSAVESHDPFSVQVGSIINPFRATSLSLHGETLTAPGLSKPHMSGSNSSSSTNNNLNSLNMASTHVLNSEAGSSSLFMRQPLGNPNGAPRDRDGSEDFEALLDEIDYLRDSNL